MTTSGDPADPAGSTPPTGTITQVLAWVDGDPVRAQAAYDAEQASTSPRSTLLAELVKAGATAGGDQ